jgi:hypothetical protein
LPVLEANNPSVCAVHTPASIEIDACVITKPEGFWILKEPSDLPRSAGFIGWLIVLPASIEIDACVITKPEGFRVFWSRPIHRMAAIISRTMVLSASVKTDA